MEEANPKFPPLQVLGSLAENPEVHDVWFNDKPVTLDGFKFVSCRFDNCQLYINSCHFELDHCFIDDNTTVIWRGELLKALRLFNSRHQWVYEQTPVFAPIRHDDGTITIVGDN